MFDRPKPTSGCSATGRRRKSVYMQIKVEYEMMHYTKQYTSEYILVEAYDIYHVRVYIVLNKCFVVLLRCSVPSALHLSNTVHGTFAG